MLRIISFFTKGLDFSDLVSSHFAILIPLNNSLKVIATAQHFMFAYHKDVSSFSKCNNPKRVQYFLAFNFSFFLSSFATWT